MNNPACWRQPIPTDINNMFTSMERAVFREILSLCQNKDELVQFTHNNRNYAVALKRGQCIFAVSRFAKEHKVDRKRIRKSIEIVSKWYSQMDSQAMPYGLIITVLSYDELTGMDSQTDSQRTVKGQSKDSQRTPNKSVKSVKSVKKKKNNYQEESKQILEKYNLLRSKQSKSTRAWYPNFVTWRKEYSLSDIEKALGEAHRNGWLWKTKDGGYLDWDLTLLFRTRNKSGECDYIDQLLNRGSRRKPNLV